MIDALAVAMLRHPRLIPALLSALLRGRLAFKTALANGGCYIPDTIPLRDDLIAFLDEQKAAGRQLHLVTASPQDIANAVANRLDLFDTVTGSKNGVNLKGAVKGQYLAERFPEGFAYVGSDASDLDVWRYAKGAITVAASSAVEDKVALLGIPVERSFPATKPTWKTWLHLLRIHQWSKNVLLFVPLVLAHAYTNIHDIMSVVAAFIFMGFVASATYIINDLSDLDADRRHATKLRRPLASGDIVLPAAVAAAGLLGLAGMTGAVLLDRGFAMCLVLYAVLTIAYSLRLKSIALLDVFVLGLLYTLRIVMGMVLLHSKPAPWLLVFSLFFFFSLSMAKRHVEIVRALERGATGAINGRGYHATDAPLTLSLGIASSAMASMLLFLYVANDAYPVGAYRNPQWLWAISPIVFLWASRVWLKSHRGMLDDDPINFALRDGPSLALGALVGLIFVLAVL